MYLRPSEKHLSEVRQNFPEHRDRFLLNNRSLRLKTEKIFDGIGSLDRLRYDEALRAKFGAE